MSAPANVKNSRPNDRNKALVLNNKQQVCQNIKTANNIVQKYGTV
jgi:hypothetical protein